MSYGDRVNQELEKNKEHIASGGNDWFKFKEGKNVIRILVEPAPMFEDFKMGICYHDCGFQGSPKFLAHIWDRTDGKIKLMKIPNIINEAIIGFESSERFSFKGFPMPYNLEVVAKNAGTKEVVYTVLPGGEDELPTNIADEVRNKKSPADIIDKLKQKNLDKHTEDGTRDKILKEREALKVQLDSARKAGKVESDIQYPTDEINPEDVQF